MDGKEDMDGEEGMNGEEDKAAHLGIEPSALGLGPNILANPGFETGAVSPWITWNGGETLTVVSGGAQAGAKALQISTRNATWATAAQKLSGFGCGKTWRVQAYVNSPNGTDTYYPLLYVNGKGYVGTGTSVTAANGWKLVTADIAMPACTLTAAYAMIHSRFSTFAFRIDSAAVQELAGGGGGGTIKWQTGHETGTFADWTVNQGGLSEFNSGTADSTITTEQKRTGSYALKQSVNTTSESGTRMFRWYTATPGEALPADAYYSAWFYYPSVVTVNNWLMLMGWKTKLDNGVSANAWFLYLANRPGGGMQLRLTDKINGVFDKFSGVAFPAGQWVRVEAYYQARANNTGRITVWQNGTQIFDANGYQTQPASSNSIARHFEVANYGQGTSPAVVNRYVDDLIISTGGRIP